MSMTAEASGCPIGGHRRTGVRTQVSQGRGDVFRLTRAPLLTRRKGDRRIPGPKGLPVAGVAPWFMRDPFTYLLTCQRKYGDVFRLPLPVWDMVVVTHPDLVVEVFHDRGGRFGMPRMPDRVEQVTGAPLPYLDGDRYTARRRLYSPMFGKRFLNGLAEPIVDEFSARLAEWERFADTGQVVDLEHELARITLPAFLRAMFSMSITEQEFRQYDGDLRQILSAMGAIPFFMKPPTGLLPIPGRPNAPRSFVRMFRAVGRIIDDRRTESGTYNDLLQMIVDARTPKGEPLTRMDVLDDTTGIIVAGYETVVAAMCWMLALLPTNPEAEQRLYAEIDTLGGRLPTGEDVDRLSWTRACFDEGQRLQGHPFNVRFAKLDTTLAGFEIPKGTGIAACMTALHRDPRWWAHPNEFDPNHFADKAQAAARPKTAFIPFGTGPHQCVGMAMAYMNAAFLTALIFQRYRIHRLPGWEPRHQANTSVTIKGGFPATITRR